MIGYQITISRCALYISLPSVPYMRALYVCLICIPYMCHRQALWTRTRFVPKKFWKVLSRKHEFSQSCSEILPPACPEFLQRPLQIHTHTHTHTHTRIYLYIISTSSLPRISSKASSNSFTSMDPLWSLSARWIKKKRRKKKKRIMTKKSAPWYKCNTGKMVQAQYRQKKEKKFSTVVEVEYRQNHARRWIHNTYTRRTHTRHTYKTYI